jgi:hypothetical protein
MAIRSAIRGRVERSVFMLEAVITVMEVVAVIAVVGRI